MKIEDELYRLKGEPKISLVLPGLGSVRFDVFSNARAIEEVFIVAREVMTVVLRLSARDWEELDVIVAKLPMEFVQRFAPLSNSESDDKWLRLWRAANASEKKLMEDTRGWQIEEWLHWMKPDERAWFWWDAVVLNQSRGKVAVAVQSWPFPWGSIKHLLLASGATIVEPEKRKTGDAIS